MSIAQRILYDPSIPPSERQQALDRIHSDPGIPNESTTSSFWLQSLHEKFAQRSSRPLPKKTDVVIIGSGITGASIARTLLQNRANVASSDSLCPAVVMLEARDICSGATGRNGGHIVDTADEYAELSDVFGEEAARKVLRFRLAHLPEMLDFAEDLGLREEAQVRKVKFLSTYFGEEPWKAALGRFHRFKKGMPEESKDWVAIDNKSLLEGLNLSKATGVISGPAGALWPYKFVTGVLAHLLSNYPDTFRIEDHTSVTAIHDNPSSKHKYRVETNRGTILARHVIHCTNAHVGYLVPGLRGRIFPVRGQMSAQTPGSNFPCQVTQHSWLFNYDRGFDYLTQLPSGQMMLGGGFTNGEGRGTADLGVSTDNELSLYCDIYLSGALRAIFGHRWGRVQGDPVQAMWTGNMAFSADGFPWVGRLPESVTHRSSTQVNEAKPNAGAEWVCAAFGGEGMVQAWLCGKALATMLLLQDNELASAAEADLSWFPEQMLVCEERAAKAILPRCLAGTRHQANL